MKRSSYEVLLLLYYVTDTFLCNTNYCFFAFTLLITFQMSPIAPISDNDSDSISCFEDYDNDNETIGSSASSCSFQDNQSKTSRASNTFGSPIKFRKNGLPLNIQKGILGHLLFKENFEKFRTELNKEPQRYGAPGSTLRKSCYNLRTRLIKLQREDTPAFLSLCVSHGLIEAKDSNVISAQSEENKTRSQDKETHYPQTLVTKESPLKMTFYGTLEINFIDDLISESFLTFCFVQRCHRNIYA